MIEVYKAYDIVREDTEAINELSVWPICKGQKDITQLVETKVKSALTRVLNKEHRLLPFSKELDITKKRRGAASSKLFI